MLNPPLVGLLPEVLVTPFSLRNGIGSDLVGGLGAGGAPSSVAWGVANWAYYIPIYMDRPGLVTKFFWMNGATANGNVDIGIYNRDYTKLITTGSTAQGTINVLQAVDVTDFWLMRGVYHLGIALSSATGTVFRQGMVTIGAGSAVGITYQTSAFPLPSPAVPIQLAASLPPPVCGFAFRTLVA